MYQYSYIYTYTFQTKKVHINYNIYNIVSEKPGKLINVHFDNIILVIRLFIDIDWLYFFSSSFSIII